MFARFPEKLFLVWYAITNVFIRIIKAVETLHLIEGVFSYFLNEIRTSNNSLKTNELQKIVFVLLKFVQRIKGDKKLCILKIHA